MYFLLEVVKIYVRGLFYHFMLIIFPYSTLMLFPGFQLGYLACRKVGCHPIERQLADPNEPRKQLLKTGCLQLLDILKIYWDLIFFLEILEIS